MVRLTRPPADPAAVDRLVARYLPVADDLARRLFDRPACREWLDEARAAAADMLVRAARLYVPGRGDFLSFARAVVRPKLRQLRARRVRQRRRRPRAVALAHDPAARPDRPAALPAALLGRLTPGQREVVDLRFALGLSYAEIGERLGKSKPSAFRQCRRAINVLRQALTPESVGQGGNDPAPAVRL